MKKTLLMIVILFTFFSRLFGDVALKLEVSVDKSDALIGDKIHLIIALERPTDSKLKEPKIEGATDHFEIHNTKIIEHKLKGDRVRSIFNYELIPFQTGTFNLDPITAELEYSSQEILKFDSNPVQITVKSLINPSDKNPDIRGPKPPLTLKSRPFWLLFTILSVLILLVFIVYLLAKKYIFSEPITKQDPVAMLTPEEEALKRLNELANSILIKEARMKEVYTLLSDILRTYLGRRFVFSSLELTTYECLRVLRAFKIPHEILTRVKSVLDESDLVKFAKYESDPAKTPAFIENTKQVVLLSREDRREV